MKLEWVSRPKLWKRPDWSKWPDWLTIFVNVNTLIEKKELTNDEVAPKLKTLKLTKKYTQILPKSTNVNNKLK